MNAVFSTIGVFLTTGFVYSVLAMGYYVTYTILDFPDLTVEGTFVSGAVTYGLLVTNGVSGYLALLCAFLVGAIFGSITGLLHVKLHIRPLLCGILVATALISVNLVLVSAGVAGSFAGDGASTVNFGRDALTLRNLAPISFLPANFHGIPVRDLVTYALAALLFKFLLDLFFKTKSGLLLRASGDNACFVTSIAKDSGNSKILGLAIGNGYAAVSGALYTNITLNANQSMGLGMVVIGLASLIIGLSVFCKLACLKPTTKVIFGAIIYQACLTGAQRLGMPSAYNKIIMAVLFTVALVLSDRLKKGGVRNA